MMCNSPVEEKRQTSSTLLTSTIATLPTTTTSKSKQFEHNNDDNNKDAETETEELLRNAFEELDQERARRIELEAELKALQESAAKTATPSPPPSTKKKSKRRSSKTSLLKDSSHNSEHHHQQQESTATTTNVVNVIALQQELEGLRQLVDAMTREKPAIAAAIQATNERRLAVQTGRPTSSSSSLTLLHPNNNSLENPTLPLHVVRLLEIMPWEPKAQEHVFGTEEIYEWQVYSVKQQQWCTQLQQFPSFFQALPLVKPTDNAVQEHQPTAESLRQPGRDRSLLMFLAGCETMGTSRSGGTTSAAALTAPPDKSVLTNADLTHTMNLAYGFPLPRHGGTWQWVGGWRIEKRVIVYAGDAASGSMDPYNDTTRRRVTLDCDEEGWTYAMDASDFLKDNPEDYCHEQAGTVEDKLTLEKASFLSGTKVVRHVVPLRKVRRRKWTRRRVLIDYPYASEQSKHFLSLLAQNASLTVAANKISDQLVETKMKLTDTQLKTHQNEEETKLKIAQLTQEIKTKEEIIAKLKKQKMDKKGIVTNNNSNNTKKTETTNKSSESDATNGKQVEPKTKELETPHQKQEPAHHHGNELQNLISQWVVSSTKQLKMISHDVPAGEEVSESSDSESPVSEVASDVSTSEVPEDDDSSLPEPSENPETTAENNADEGNHNDNTHNDNDADNNTSASRRNSTSSTNSQKSFDWKKLGRDTIEKLKQGQAAAAHAPLLWLNAASSGKDQSQQHHQEHHQEQPQDEHTESVNASSSSSRPAESQLQNEEPDAVSHDCAAKLVSESPEMAVGA